MLSGRPVAHRHRHRHRSRTKNTRPHCAAFQVKIAWMYTCWMSLLSSFWSVPMPYMCQSVRVGGDPLRPLVAYHPLPGSNFYVALPRAVSVNQAPPPTARRPSLASQDAAMPAVVTLPHSPHMPTPPPVCPDLDTHITIAVIRRKERKKKLV